VTPTVGTGARRDAAEGGSTAAERGARGQWRTRFLARASGVGRRSRTGRQRARTLSTRWAVGQFALAGLLALVLLAGIGMFAVRRLAIDEAAQQATTLTTTEINAVVGPLVTDALAQGDPRAVAAVDHVVRSRVLDSQVVRVKVWTPDGLVLYSDEARLIGHRFTLSDDDLRTLHTGQPTAEVTTLQAEENVYERDAGQLLQVYERVLTPSGRPLLFELYVRYDPIVANAGQLGAAIAPAFLLALVALEILQLPLAWRLVRRLRAGQRERDALNRRALEASDLERRRIARDLHDGVVQSLAGVSYSLAAVQDLAAAQLPQAVEPLGAAARSTRRSIAELRSMIFRIHPPNLEQLGLPAALDELASDLSDDPIVIHRQLPDAVDLAPDRSAAVYRAAQEALRNVAAHAHATEVNLSLARVGADVVLTVTDDGAGFDPNALSDRENTHFGLRLLTELAQECGGGLELTSAPGEGTTFTFRLPAT
jgi:two-component system NarL family sensor kinase